MTNIPNGIYGATFVGINDYCFADAKRRIARQPRWYWQFAICNGPYEGSIIGKASSTHRSEFNICGKLIAQLTTAVDGVPLPFGEFAGVLYEGERVRIWVYDGKLIEVMAPRIFPVRVWG
jgi:hypothetical protein